MSTRKKKKGGTAYLSIFIIITPLENVACTCKETSSFILNF